MVSVSGWRHTPVRSVWDDHNPAAILESVLKLSGVTSVVTIRHTTTSMSFTHTVPLSIICAPIRVVLLPPLLAVWRHYYTVHKQHIDTFSEKNQTNITTSSYATVSKLCWHCVETVLVNKQNWGYIKDYYIISVWLENKMWIEMSKTGLMHTQHERSVFKRH